MSNKFDPRCTILLFNTIREKKYYLQYYVYDFNAFVADVGGYLGLLLGHSIFGMFEPIIKFISKCPSWMGGFRKKCTSRGPNEVAPLSTNK